MPHRLALHGLRGMVWGLALAALGACGDDTSTPDAAADAEPPPPTCDDPPSLSGGLADGHAAPLGAGPGEARAGRLDPGEWPRDADGLSTVAAGDFVLANDRVAVVIEDVGDSDNLDSWGGKLVGLGRVRGGMVFEQADFNELIPLVDRFTVETAGVTVLADGSDGGAAVVRALGRLSAVPFFDPIARTLIPGELGDIDVALDWILAPDAEHVDVALELASSRGHRTPVRFPLVFLFQSERMPQWIPGHGFRSTEDAIPFVAYVEDEGTSFAWQDPTGDLQPFLELSGATIFRHQLFEIAPCSVTRREYARLHVGGPGLDGLLQAVARTEGRTLREITGRVTESDGAPSAGVRVHALSLTGEHLTRTTSDADGRYALHVPAEEVALTTHLRGAPPVDGVRVPVATATADLVLPETGWLQVGGSDPDTGEALPARVQVLADAPPPEPARALGEPAVTPGRLHVAFPAEESVRLRVPPGGHTVVVSRGYERELFTRHVTVAAGETAQVGAALPRVIETPGVMCGDFHIHTHRSMDSQDHARLKVRSLLADGVEIAVRSDHEWIGDFEPLLAELGLERWAYGIGSLELTTFDWGHFGVFPLDADPAAVNAGAFRWAGRLPPEVFAEIRGRRGTHGAAAIIINHPRTFPGLMGEGAYFQRAGYDPLTRTVARPDLWDEDFSLVEVFNETSFDENAETVADWFSFLGGGRRVFAVGSSDSHEVADVPVGYPRTCITLDLDLPEDLRIIGAGHVRDRLVAGRATVSGGIFLEATSMGGAGPGQEVMGAAARERVSVRVQAPSWVEVDTLRVFVDGALAETIAIDDTTADPMRPTTRFDDVVEVDVAAGALGSFVVLVASGATTLEPVHPGRQPFAVTNPIFFRR